MSSIVTVPQKYTFSNDFQDLLLACLMRHPDKFALQGEALLPKFFNGAQAYDVAFEIKAYAKKYGKLPDFTVLGNCLHSRYVTRNPDRAKQCNAYVEKIYAIDTSDHMGVRDLVVKFARERAILIGVAKVLDSAGAGEDIEGGIVKLFEDAVSVGTNMDDVGIWMHTDIDLVREKLNSVDFGVPTGYPLLDKVWKRGWGKGWLIVPIAPPKRFKSTFCLNLALNMAGPAINSDVLYYACEISQELAFMRGLLNVTGCTEDEMYQSPEGFWLKAKQTVPMMLSGNVMFKSFPAKTTTISQIKAHAKNVIRQTGVKPRAIVLDYAETISPSDTKNTSDWRQQASIYTEARSMGDELGTCIIMPDRCNAAAVDKKVPSMKSFQGAFEKAGIVDLAIGLCATEAEYKMGIVRYFIPVNRHGPQYLHFRGKVDPSCYRMTIDEEIEYNPDAEEDEEGGGDYRKKGPRPKKSRKRSGDLESGVANTPGLED